MPDDVVEGVRAQVEALVPSFKRAEGEVELKRGVEASNEGESGGRWKHRQFAPDSVVGAARCADTLKQWAGWRRRVLSTTARLTSSRPNPCSRRSGEAEHRDCCDNGGGRRVWGVLQRRCDAKGRVLPRPEHLCLLVRVARAVHDAAAVCCERQVAWWSLCGVLRQRLPREVCRLYGG